MSAQNPDELTDLPVEGAGAGAPRSPETGPSDESACAGAELPGDAAQPTHIGPAPDGADGIEMAPAAEVPLGSLGNYKLLAKLGEGGMGTVFRAQHTKLERIVALKTLPATRLQDSQAVGRFEREMRAVGKLQHPHIVAAHDAGEIDGTHYLVMELVEGIDLGTLAKNFGALPIAEACELIRQAALGLQHAHEHGLVHRDIKPSNLMLARAAQPGAAPIVKVLDLGLALLDEGQVEGAAELTSTGQVMGTVDYMAPEQGSDTHKVDARADIYSLGATLYRLLTGKVPFAQYDTAIKKLMALATKEPPPTVSVRPDCPVALAALVQQMLAKDPAARPPSAAALAGALEPFANGADLRGLLSPSALQQPDGPPSGSTAVARNTAASAYDETHLGVVPGRDTTPAAGSAAAATSFTGTADNPFGIDWSDRLPSSRLVLRRNSFSLRARIGAAALAAVALAAGAYFLFTSSPPRREWPGVADSRQKADPETAGLEAPPIDDHERIAAAWVLGNGGTVKLDGRDQEIRDAAFLPERPFQLTAIALPENYHGVGITDNLQNLPHVTELSMGGSFVGNAQAAIVRDMPELVSLNMSHCPVGDDGLAHLVGHKQLAQLGLYYAVNVRDDGLQYVSGLTGLTILHVGGTQVTDDGLEHLAGLLKLKELLADDTRLTGVGFRHLTELKKLDYLHLANAAITDEGVAEICRLPALRHLNLENTQITDASLELLGKHPSLVSLHLDKCRLSAEAVARLRKSLPGAAVRFEGPPGAGPASPPATEETALSPCVAKAHRLIAEWVLQNRGKATIIEGAHRTEIGALDELPGKVFRVVSVQLPDETAAPEGQETGNPLAPYVGTWDEEMVFAPSEYVPESRKETWREKIEWKFGRNILWGEPIPPASPFVRVWMYERPGRLVRAWYVNDRGESLPTIATFDPADSELVFSSSDAEGHAFRLTQRFSDPDHYEWHNTMRDKSGKRLLDTTGKSTRIK